MMEQELKSGLIAVVKAEKECDVYCPICHKLLHVTQIGADIILDYILLNNCNFHPLVFKN